MDYQESFRLIQTSLNYCNEFIKKFEKINFYGGNELYINEITSHVKNILYSYGLDDSNQEYDELRKINLLLMLNTDATFKFDLNQDRKICHLLNNFAQLSKCLYINLMWQLKLEKYFYESIKYSPSWFVLQFLDETIDSLRFSKSFDVIYQIKDLVQAVFINICRMDFKHTNKSDFIVDQKIILGKFLDFIVSCLRHYNTPITDETVTKSKVKLRKYNGFSLNNQLALVLNCIKLLQNKPDFSLNEKFHIYKLMLEKEPEVNNFSTSEYSSTVSESLNNIVVILLNTLQNSVLNVTLDDFMYWVEIDIEDNSTEDVDLKRDNLQKLIGEQSYELVEILNSNKCFEHNIVDQLSTICIKPKSLNEIAKEATVGTILDKIEKSVSPIIWLEELLERPNTLYFNSECLQTIIENIEIVELKHLLKILKDHQNANEMDVEDENQMNQIFLQGGSELNVNNIQVFIEALINTLGTDYNISNETDMEFEQEITNYMNKITEDNIDENTMWKIILKSPQTFYENLLKDITNQDELQITTINKIIFITNAVSCNYIKNIVIQNLETYDATNSKSTYHLFLSQIFKKNIIERKEFIRNVLMANFSKALSSNNSLLLFMLLQVLKRISSNVKIEDFLPPLIIQISQIIDTHRWDIMSYSVIREEIVEISITIIKETTKTILLSGSKNDKEWILSKINNCKPMTKYYFQKLSLEKGEAIVPFDKFLHPEGFENIPKTKITSFLCETIVRCTSKEVKLLMNNEILQNSVTQSMQILAIIVAKSNQQIPLECFRKCITDYAKVLMDLIIPAAVSKNQESLLLKEIINLLKKIPTSLHEDLTILFLESLKLFSECENFISLISEVGDCELKRVLLE